MSHLYTFMVGIHILGAIVGIGPTLFVYRMLKACENSDELVVTHKMIAKLNALSSIGFGLLFISGLVMGFLNRALFQSAWYLLAIALMVILAVYSSIFIEPKMKSMLKISMENKGKHIPVEYTELLRKISVSNIVEKSLIVMILVLMVFKPF
ncbi:MULTISPECIES: DUF2269 family protein [Ureibacillus]|uniref:Putative membrane protein n=1 Tax=Ureibacillus thermosphaericus TaxID=51173 RepID=A0A840PZD6_URETH|nr:DUF2269 family protein [Ureibacillus thermosphaericus]MBB5149588.1 putative membrane protein [Ureibacillus thermosphaericus]NKZ31990.1 DUF2269 family protein [Ureibacillus thermosphaericus]